MIDMMGNFSCLKCPSQLTRLDNKYIPNIYVVPLYYMYKSGILSLEYSIWTHSLSLCLPYLLIYKWWSNFQTKVYMPPLRLSNSLSLSQSQKNYEPLLITNDSEQFQETLNNQLKPAFINFYFYILSTLLFSLNAGAAAWTI